MSTKPEFSHVEVDKMDPGCAIIGAQEEGTEAEWGRDSEFCREWDLNPVGLEVKTSKRIFWVRDLSVEWLEKGQSDILMVLCKDEVFS